MLTKVWHLDHHAAHANFPDVFMSAILGFKGDGSQAAAASALFHEGLYAMVAAVPSGSVEDAWAMTNHIYGTWNENPALAATPGDHRSSAVGDLFEHGGSWSVCASVGFEPVDIPSRPAPSPRANRGPA